MVLGTDGHPLVGGGNVEHVMSRRWVGKPFSESASFFRTLSPVTRIIHEIWHGLPPLVSPKPGGLFAALSRLTQHNVLGIT
jgi:hypothetical protein